MWASSPVTSETSVSAVSMSLSARCRNALATATSSPISGTPGSCADRRAVPRALSCSGATRSDVIVTDKGEVFILEVNTLPGMTATSLVPKIAAGNGISFPDLCERLLDTAALKA